MYYDSMWCFTAKQRLLSMRQKILMCLRKRGVRKPIRAGRYGEYKEAPYYQLFWETWRGSNNDKRKTLQVLFWRPNSAKEGQHTWGGGAGGLIKFWALPLSLSLSSWCIFTSMPGMFYTRRWARSLIMGLSIFKAQFTGTKTATVVNVKLYNTKQPPTVHRGARRIAGDSSFAFCVRLHACHAVYCIYIGGHMQ